MRPQFTVPLASSGALVLLCAGLYAQSPVSATVRTLEARAARNLTEAAEDMPADQYGFKPTPAQMTFGQVVLHVAGGNAFLCSALAGTAPPERPKLTPTDPKPALVARLKESFDLCASALERADDTNLGDSIPFFGGRKTTRAAALIELAVDWADHYGQVAMYLRLSGLLPPTAKRKQH